MQLGPIGLAALVAALIGSAAPAQAQYWQGRGSWCIMPPPGAGTWDCSYHSRWQCEQTAAGRRPCTPSPAAEWDRREGKKTKAKKQRDY
jgi:Protein of unknown function (DUF3551)